MTINPLSVFQLGLFLRALRPARTGLRPARFTRALPEFKKKTKNIINLKTKINFVLFLQNVGLIAVFVFSDSRCKNACKLLADVCPCFHQSPIRPNFGRSRVKVCPNFGCSRARMCPISFAPCPFPNLAGTLIMYTVQLTKYVETNQYLLTGIPSLLAQLVLVRLHRPATRSPYSDPRTWNVSTEINTSMYIYIQAVCTVYTYRLSARLKSLGKATSDKKQCLDGSGAL